MVSECPVGAGPVGGGFVVGGPISGGLVVGGLVVGGPVGAGPVSGPRNGCGGTTVFGVISSSGVISTGGDMFSGVSVGVQIGAKLPLRESVFCLSALPRSRMSSVMSILFGSPLNFPVYMITNMTNCEKPLRNEPEKETFGCRGLGIESPTVPNAELTSNTSRRNDEAPVSEASLMWCPSMSPIKIIER